MFDVMFSNEGWLFSIPAMLGTFVFLRRFFGVGSIPFH